MANGEIVADSGTTSQNGEDLVLGLPPFLPKSTESGNFKLLDIIGRGFDRLDDDIRDVDEASTVQTANTIPEIAALAKLVDTRPRANEQKEKYRARAIARFQQITGEGTIEGILNNVSTLLNISPTKVRYDPYTVESGAVLIEVPKPSLDTIGLTEAEFVDIANGQLAAGYRLVVQFSGTFTYRSVADEANLVNDPDKAYTGLNADGTKDDTSGGTYAGIIS